MSEKIRRREKRRVQQKKRRIIIICVLVVLLAVLIAIYALLQDHIIYTSDGIHFDFFDDKQTETVTAEAPPDENPRIEKPRFSPKASPSVSVDNGDLPPFGAPPVDAVYIDLSAMSLQALAEEPARLVKENVKSIVIDIKGSGGRLNYDSQTELSQQFTALDTAGGALEAFIAECAQRSIRVAGRVCCLRDPLLAQKSPDCALHAGGKLYTDAEGGAWLDPQNEQVRQYICDICAEAAALGLREIILDELAYPAQQDEQTRVSGRIDAVNSLLEAISEKLENRVYLSAVTYEDVWGEGASETRGQNLDALLSACGRIFLRCSDEDTARTCRNQAANMGRNASDKLAFIIGGRYVSSSELFG